MKHYINKQSRKNTQDGEKVVFPPDVDITRYKENGINALNYKAEECALTNYGKAVGGAVSQAGGYNKQTSVDAENAGYIEECPYLSGYVFNNLKGNYDFIEIPENPSKPYVLDSMMRHMDKYLGRFVCLDLWNTDSIRVEKCGILEVADDGHILLRGTEELTMIDLSSVKYVNIYCR